MNVFQLIFIAKYNIIGREHSHTHTRTLARTLPSAPTVCFLAMVNLEKQIDWPELNLTFPCRKTKNVSKAVASVTEEKSSFLSSEQSEDIQESWKVSLVGVKPEAGKLCTFLKSTFFIKV